MAYSGSCMDMCPENERRTRFGAYVSIFECDKNNQPDEFSMVKAYRRSGADQEEPAPEDLRTHQALENTMNHLVSNVMNDPRSVTAKLALDWYDFLWDRLRAIRKDITQQNICDQASAILVEKCARFHVHSCYAMNRVKDFDVDMNKRNLNDCLQMLRQMYTDLKTSSGTKCPGELEFQIYDLLLHLDEDHLSSNIIMKTSEYRNTKEMKEIIRVFSSYTSNNYHQFFKFMRRANYMTSCLLSLYANKMRLIGLRMIAAACPSRQSTLYPMENIIKLLGFDDVEDVEAFAAVLEMTIQKTDKQAYIVLNKELVARLRQPDLALPPFKSRQLVEDKMQLKQVGQLIQNKMHYEEVDRTVQNEIKYEVPVEQPFGNNNKLKHRQLNQATAAAVVVENNIQHKPVEQIVARNKRKHSQVDQLNENKRKYKLENHLPIENKLRQQQHHHHQEQVGQLIQRPANINEAPKFNCDLKSNNLTAPAVAFRFEPMVKEPLTQIDQPPKQVNFRFDLPVSPQRPPVVVVPKVEQQQSPPKPKRDDSVDCSDRPEECPTEDQVVPIQTDAHEEKEEEEEVVASRESSPDMQAIAEHRNYVATMMPAGRFRNCSLADKRPTLTLPPATNDDTPTKRRRSDDKRKSTESIRSRIEDEEKVNKILAQLSSMIANY